jgi:hypothetical protein
VKNKEMNTKSKALTLLSVIVIATVASAIVLTMQAATADTNNSVASDIESTNSTSSVNATDNTQVAFGGFGGFMMTGESGFGGGHRGMRMDREFGGFGAGAIQVSSDFTANVTNIANADTDVQNLISQGFNITSIHPVISTTIDGNGNIVTKASTANVLLEGNNGSRSLVVVDLSQAKVTKIVTLTVTEIDK